jgi:hypothetical protein
VPAKPTPCYAKRSPNPGRSASRNSCYASRKPVRTAIAEINKTTDLISRFNLRKDRGSDQRFDFYEQDSRETETRWCKVVKRPSGSAPVPNFIEPMKAKLAGWAKELTAGGLLLLEEVDSISTEMAAFDEYLKIAS